MFIFYYNDSIQKSEGKFTKKGQKISGLLTSILPGEGNFWISEHCGMQLQTGLIVFAYIPYHPLSHKTDTQTGFFHLFFFLQYPQTV